VAGHEGLQVPLKRLPVRVQRVRLGQIQHGAAGPVVGGSRPPLQRFLHRLPRGGKVLRQEFQVGLAPPALFLLSPPLFQKLVRPADPAGLGGVSPQLAHRAQWRRRPGSSGAPGGEPGLQLAFRLGASSVEQLLQERGRFFAGQD